MDTMMIPIEIFLICSFVGLISTAAILWIFKRIANKIWRDLLLLKNDMGYLREKADNDIQSALLDIAYKHLNDLDTKSKPVMALSQHMRTKIEFVSRAYNEAKQYYKKHRNFAIVNNDGFAAALMGSGGADLQRLYTEYPPSFLSKVDKINQDSYDDFKNSIILNLANTPEADVFSVLKTCVVGTFTRNVSLLIKCYLKNEVVITDEDEPVGTDVKLLISDDKLSEALDQLYRTSSDIDVKDEVILAMARLTRFKKSERAGIEPSENLNTIRKSILELC